MKRLAWMRWPRTLLGRNLVVMIPLVLACQAISFALWVLLVQLPRVSEGAALVGSQILTLDRLLASLPEAERRAQLAALKAVTTEALPPTATNATEPPGYTLNQFFRRLSAQLPPRIQLRWEVAPVRQLWVQLRSSDDLWVALPAETVEGRNVNLILLLILFVTTGFPALGMYLLHRAVERPLQALASSASEIARGRWPPEVPVQGPQELATVTQAFNGMSAALAESEAVRAEMLAGISHDIRTPLTKLRMLASAPELFDAPGAHMGRLIEEIDAIVGQFIDFARQAEGERPVMGDLQALLAQLAAEHRGLGHAYALQLGPLPRLAYRPLALRRALGNLMHNAETYGKTGLLLRCWVEGDLAVVSVEDAGPGVPAASLEQLKRPFYRGTRSQGPGAGLGLAIAERIARQHGGSLLLALRPAGGLAAQLRLPLDPGPPSAPLSSPLSAPPQPGPADMN